MKEEASTTECSMTTGEGVDEQKTRRLDTSEPSSENTNNNNPNNNNNSSTMMRFLPTRLLCFQKGSDIPLELEGLTLDVFARATILMSSLFLGPALLDLATEACQEKYEFDINNNNNDAVVEAEFNQNCRIYGFRPSSLLTNIATVSGVFVSLLLPFIGAIVDHTRYRRQLGTITAIGLVLVKAIEIGVGPQTWLWMAGLQILSSILYNPHITASYAYTSELTNDPILKNNYNTHLNVVLYGASLFFLVLVLGIATGLGTDDLGTARLSQVLTTVLSAGLFGICWTYLFRDRDALSDVPDGSNLVTCGFRRVLETAHKIRKQYASLRWFILAVMFGEAASAALVTVATTFMKEMMDMSANEIGFAFLAFLLAAIPGSKLGGWISLYFNNPLQSARLCSVFSIVVTTLAAATLKGPQHKKWFYLFTCLWGLSLGWIHPVNVTIFMSIIPKGQEAEMMGTYLLCGQVLSWFPNLIFTVFNENGLGMAYGVGSLNIFFGIGLACLYIMGSYDTAVTEAATAAAEDTVVKEGADHNKDIEIQLSDDHLSSTSTSTTVNDHPTHTGQQEKVEMLLLEQKQKEEGKCSPPSTELET